MASLNFVRERHYLRKGNIGQIRTDTPVALRLHAKSAAGAVTSVTTTTATNIVAITASGGTETWDFATYSTVGLLADKINSSNYWECKVLDTLRSKATATQFVNGAITATSSNGLSYYDVKVDTSAALYFAYRLAYTREVGVSDKMTAPHRVVLREFAYSIDVGTAAADNVQVWQWDPVNKNETQLLSYPSVDTTLTTVNWASGVGFISAENSELVVMVKDAGSLADLAANYLTVVGELE